MSDYTNYPNNADANETDGKNEAYNSELYIVETEDRLEMVQAAEAIDLSCCGDS